MDIFNKLYIKDYSNITDRIISKLNKSLHTQPNHPLEIIKREIYSCFGEFTKYDNLDKVVSIEDNFDKLLIPKDHVSRSKSDTYYVNNEYVLRTHTSAHQNELLKQNIKKFLVTGDVYRKDEIDKNHHCVFHQTEGVCIIENDQDAVKELIKVINSIVVKLFGQNCKWRWNDDYFPFTDPSFEVEVMYNGEWLEVLGCGIVQPKILENNGIIGKNAWAFGLGLERLAMILFDIKDIRYFWSNDSKFINQFKDGKITKFIEYSIQGPISLDISFWIPKEYIKNKVEWDNVNNFFSLCYEVAGDIIENIKCIDTFYNKNKDIYSKAYRLTYKPIDTKINDPGKLKELTMNIHSRIVERIKDLGVTLK